MACRGKPSSLAPRSKSSRSTRSGPLWVRLAPSCRGQTMNDIALIVDDSMTVRMDLADAFEGAGFTVLPCGTVAEARKALAAGPINVVVLDVNLPDGDGIEFLKDVRSSESASVAVVLMLSPEAEVKDRIRG